MSKSKLLLTSQAEKLSHNTNQGLWRASQSQQGCLNPFVFLGSVNEICTLSLGSWETDSQPLAERVSDHTRNSQESYSLSSFAFFL